MKLYQIVLKDITRRKKRMLYASLGVVIGVATIIAVLTIALAGETDIYGQLEKYGANLVVMPAISDIDVGLGGLSLGTLAVGENYISENELPQIRQIADGMIREALNIEDEGDIATIAPRLYMNTEIKGTSVIIVGVDPQQEWQLKTWWRIRDGEYLERADQALVGAMAADLLELNVGDKIALNGREVTITGILEETGSNEDYQVFLHIKTVQEAFDKEGLVSSIDVRALCSACPTSDIAGSINGNIPGVRAVAVKQIAETEMGMMEKVSKFLLALAGITLAVGCFGVVNTMLTSVHERIRDIGIMRAVGASRNQIIRIFLYEAIIIGVVGGLLGYVVGTLLAYIVGPLIFGGVAVTYVPQYFLPALALATFIAVIATVYPAFRASKIKIADSFRSL
ncbi:MAG: FtsX-like permease family protein [Dehalococcoidia bacterium]|nr:MAG: FtsX-like permease family protein [Dehalococcoidia bacterium]